MKDDKPTTSSKTVILLVTLGLLIIGFSLYTIMTLDPGTKPGPQKAVHQMGNAAIGGAFKLKTTKGASFSEQNLVGKYSLVYFGFASCPDICPATLQKVTLALNELPISILNQIQPIFISVDHERDDASLLQEFLDDFHPKFVGLYGTESEVKNVTDMYKVFYKKVSSDKEDQENYLIDHTAIIYMMDKKGNYLRHLSLNASADDIKNLLLEHVK